MTKKPYYSRLGLAIFCTIIFSFIAFPGIIYASKANTRYTVGDLEEAQRYNKIAGYWCFASVILGILLIYFQFSVLNQNTPQETSASKTTVFKEFFSNSNGQAI